MNNDNQKVIIVCGTTTEMLKADSIIRDNHIEVDLVPTPSQYGSICSTSIALEEVNKITAERILEKIKIKYNIYPYRVRKLLGLMESLKKAKLSTAFQVIMNKIEMGHELTKDDIVVLLNTEEPKEIETLYSVADRLRKEIVGDIVEIRGAIEFSNYCKKSCNYCGIRKGCDLPHRYRMDEDEIMEAVHQLVEMGIRTVILQSGEDDYYDTEMLCGLLKKIKKVTKMGITLSIGERSRFDYLLLREAGANNFLLKIETTNRKIFESIHPDNDYDQRIQCAKWLKELGYVNGSGNMIGLPGQKIEDIAEDILYFKEMGIHMIGIGPFIPAPGTPYEDLPTGSVEMTLKAIAVTRIVCKNVFLPATTALASIDPDGQRKALEVGANTIMLISTPEKYRTSYQLYKNKNMIDIESALEAVKNSNRKLPKYLKLPNKEGIQ
ncbi:[FeFe] hydrogenase H-cluster radical SAM maturase HydE [Alkaliphilus peptidifermentans]|uniref:Iron-only hydrogenase maturation protein HydE n=1 Tax=Alkaliphilus peptidifermentans DSM 18978 TaxID=1120976 RepID=A0A1G5LDM9_9FIRM|nr:[FeFe] hydrogenase H-cluster radical SAM maturase HydE [Alkaliphilus peptidifermentans]SCZ10916.1 iron-only hydrogenase maturation protein HydE [Alkaliphilus peptidifermentans DSM 18978]